MAKIRGVKPEFWTDENVVELSIPARLLFIGLWNHACDNGHLQDKSKQIKMRVLPTDDVNCAELLREIESQGLIERADGWITVPNLTSHQKPHKRWFVLCDKPGCEFPEGATYGYSKPESPVDQPLSNGGSPVNNGGSTADVDGDVDGEVMVSGKSPTKSSKAAKRPHSLPDDFEPNETNRRVAAEHGVDIARILPQFADHHRAKGSTMKDWHAALNTWIRRERPSGPVAQPQARPISVHDLETPPSGLTDEEYLQWDYERRQRRGLA